MLKYKIPQIVTLTLGYMNPCGFWCDECTGRLIFHIIVLFRVKAEKRLPYPVSRNRTMMIAEAKTMCGKGSRQYLKIGHKKSPQTCEHYTMHIDNQSGLLCFALQI